MIVCAMPFRFLLFHSDSLTTFMKKRSGFFVFTLLCCLRLSAQEADTLLQLRVVEVQGVQQPNRRQPALQVYQVDTLLRRSLVAGSAADWLAMQGPVSLRSYGPAGLATASVRGAGSQQLALLWDGMSLLNPMNSTADLNLLPLWLFSDVQLQTGSSASDFGSAAIGGALHLGQAIPANNQLAVFTEARSFGDFSGGWAATHRSKRWWLSSRGLRRTADNDFPYLNSAKSGAPAERLAQSATASTGLMHEIGWVPTQNHRLRLRWWYQANDRQLPASMTSNTSTASQADTASRILLNYQFSWRHWGVQARAAYLNELNAYLDPMQGFNEHHRFRAAINEMQLQYCSEHPLQGSLLLQQAHYSAQSPNYEGAAIQNRLAVVPSLRYQGGKSSSQLQLRMEQVGGQLVPLTPALQHEQRFARTFALHAALSRNYRLPSLNDLYWQPGGNSDLQPELGWSSEIALHKSIQTTKHHFQLRSGGFYTDVSNWMIWLPNPNLPYWSPRNLRRVRSSGFEQQIKWQHQRGAYRWQAEANYAYVRSVNAEVGVGEEPLHGKQLIYVPRHQFRTHAFVQHSDWQIGLQFANTGLRYTSSDNSSQLPAYPLSSFLLGRDLRWGQSLLRLNAGVHNLFNHSYQAVAWRPMPGRHFHLTLTYQIHKKS